MTDTTAAHINEDHAAREYDAACDSCQQTALENARELYEDDEAAQAKYLRSHGLGFLVLSY